jgi:hypothetical protein
MDKAEAEAGVQSRDSTRAGRTVRAWVWDVFVLGKVLTFASYTNLGVVWELEHEKLSFIHGS